MAVGVAAGDLSADAEDQVAAIDMLGALVDNSLIRQHEATGEPRFSMLGTIREFGLEALAFTGELDEARNRHAAYFVALAEAGFPRLRGADRLPWLIRLDEAYDNLRCRACLALPVIQCDVGRSARWSALALLVVAVTIRRRSPETRTGAGAARRLRPGSTIRAGAHRLRGAGRNDGRLRAARRAITKKRSRSGWNWATRTSWPTRCSFAGWWRSTSTMSTA